tara:strand:+ start:104 stop:1462 length:1359 start_codon:yes stop_codon:yes gene_type:complete
MYQTFATRIVSLVGDAITANAIDENAFTEWLTEEAMNAIDIMNPEMLISASSTHRLTEAEQFNDCGKNVDGSVTHAADLTVLPLTSAGTLVLLKVGSIIASKAGSTIYPERMKVISINGLNIGIERGVNGTTADTIAGGRDIVVVQEKSFNTRKFKLLEVNRDGYSAKIIPSGLVKQSNDPNSIHHATKRSPAYYIKSGNIHIRPLVNGYEQGEIIGLTYPVVKYNMKSTTDLPIQAEDFIVTGAARKYLVRSMYEEFAQLPAGITTTSAPSAPSLSSNQVAVLGTAPVYTAPSIGGETEELTGAITDGGIGTDADFQDVSDWWEVLGHMIEDEEDNELASAQIQKISTYLNAYAQAMQNKLNIFNDANVEYQAALQRAIENARLSSQDDAQALQKYQAQLQSYSNDLNNKNQIFSSALQRATTKYNWFIAQYDKLTLMYNEKAQILRGAQA